MRGMGHCTGSSGYYTHINPNPVASIFTTLKLYELNKQLKTNLESIQTVSVHVDTCKKREA